MEPQDDPEGGDCSGSSNISLDNYIKEAQLGSGSFGTVFKYIRKEGVTNGPKALAVKEILQDYDQLKETKREIEFARELNHANVIHYYGVEMDTTTVYIVMELAKMSLEEFIRQWQPFSEAEWEHLAKHLACGLIYVHSQNVIHRDIKPHNILITWRDGFDPLSPRNIRGIIPKLCDFGLGRYISDGLDGQAAGSLSKCGNPLPMRPELREVMDRFPGFRDGVKAVDVFWLGAVFSRMDPAKAKATGGVGHVSVSSEVTIRKVVDRFRNGDRRELLQLMTSRNPVVCQVALECINFSKHHAISGSAKLNAADQLTNLQGACARGQLELVEAICQNGDAVNEADMEGYSPLHWATMGGHAQVVTCLLEHGAEVEAETNDGETPLFIAAVRNNADLANILLAAKADVGKVANDGRTPLLLSALLGYTGMAELLLTKGADVDGGDFHGRTPLMYAAKDGNGAMAELLLRSGASVNKTGNVGLSALMIAAVFDQAEMSALLIEAGADIDLLDNNGWTALMFACQEGYLDVVQILVDRGASMDIVGRMSDGGTALMLACYYGHSGIAELLVRKGAELNLAGMNGSTPLLFACEFGHVEIVMLLIKAGAKINQGDDNGTTPLMTAAQNGHVGAARLLIESDAAIDQTDKEGWTALTYACQHGRIEMARLLSENGASIDHADKFSQTSSSLASEMQQAEIENFITEMKSKRAAGISAENIN